MSMENILSNVRSAIEVKRELLAELKEAQTKHDKLKAEVEQLQEEALCRINTHRKCAEEMKKRRADQRNRQPLKKLKIYDDHPVPSFRSRTTPFTIFVFG